MIKTMGLETLLEAAKYLEYRAEVEARGESLCKHKSNILYTALAHSSQWNQFLSTVDTEWGLSWMDRNVVEALLCSVFGAKE